MSKPPEQKCAICLELFENPTMNNGCNHVFCFVCIDIWSRKTNACPLCKTRFTELVQLDKLRQRRHKTRQRQTRAPARIKVLEKQFEPSWDADELIARGLSPEASDERSDIDDGNEDSEQERHNRKRRRAQQRAEPEADEDYVPEV